MRGQSIFPGAARGGKKTFPTFLFDTLSTACCCVRKTEFFYTGGNREGKGKSGYTFYASDAIVLGRREKTRENNALLYSYHRGVLWDYVDSSFFLEKTDTA